MAEHRWVDVGDDCYYTILRAAGLFFGSDLDYKRFSFALNGIRRIAMDEFDKQNSADMNRSRRK